MTASNACGVCQCGRSYLRCHLCCLNLGQLFGPNGFPLFRTPNVGITDFSDGLLLFVPLHNLPIGVTVITETTCNPGVNSRLECLIHNTIAVRRMRKPTRSEPKAGHMLCG